MEHSVSATEPQPGSIFPEELDDNQRYVTMGQSHVHSVDGQTIDRNSVVLIICPDNVVGMHPRDYIFDVFGSKWCFEYQHKPNMAYFPRGIIVLTIHE